jgi:hypothetical protein
MPAIGIKVGVHWGLLFAMVQAVYGARKIPATDRTTILHPLASTILREQAMKDNSGTIPERNIHCWHLFRVLN